MFGASCNLRRYSPRAGANSLSIVSRREATILSDRLLERFGPFLKVIKQRSNFLTKITTGRASTMTFIERLCPLALFKREILSRNFGSMTSRMCRVLKLFR